MKVEALKHTDVRNQEKYYLKFNTKTQEYLMNVGEKTFLQVSAMVAEESAKPIKEEVK